MTEIEIIARAQQLERFAYSQTPLTVSEITKRLNELVNLLQCSTLKNGVITEWLFSRKTQNKRCCLLTSSERDKTRSIFFCIIDNSKQIIYNSVKNDNRHIIR